MVEDTFKRIGEGPPHGRWGPSSIESEKWAVCMWSGGLGEQAGLGPRGRSLAAQRLAVCEKRTEKKLHFRLHVKGKAGSARDEGMYAHPYRGKHAHIQRELHSRLWRLAKDDGGALPEEKRAEGPAAL